MASIVGDADSTAATSSRRGADVAPASVFAQCFFVSSFKPSWQREQMRMLSELFGSKSSLKHGWKSVFDNGVLASGLVLGFLYESTLDDFEICIGGTHYANDKDCSNPDDGLFSFAIDDLLAARHYVVIVTALVAAATMGYSLQLTCLVARTPDQAFSLWLDYAPMRLYVEFYLIIGTIVCFLVLILLNLILRLQSTLSSVCLIALGIALLCFLALLNSTKYMHWFVLKAYSERLKQKSLMNTSARSAGLGQIEDKISL